MAQNLFHLVVSTVLFVLYCKFKLSLYICGCCVLAEFSNTKSIKTWVGSFCNLIYSFFSPVYVAKILCIFLSVLFFNTYFSTLQLYLNVVGLV